jgi:hypothetical protein
MDEVLAFLDPSAITILPASQLSERETYLESTSLLVGTLFKALLIFPMD